MLHHSTSDNIGFNQLSETNNGDKKCQKRRGRREKKEQRANGKINERRRLSGRREKEKKLNTRVIKLRRF